MLTRSAARALLAQTYVHVSFSCTLGTLIRSFDANISRRVNLKSDHIFPDDVLLEIFDAYRQDVELLPHYENIWNSKDGWFRLAHVCTRWRRVVLLSPTCLHLHLHFIPRSSSKVTMLERLPPFPILVDYRAASWIEKENRALAVIMSNHSRVCGIALRTPYMDKVCRALSHPFPELESLEILPSFPHDHEVLILPGNFLSGSVPCLRRLTLRKVAPGCLSSLLSSATGLVELNLSLNTEWGSPPEVRSFRICGACLACVAWS